MRQLIISALYAEAEPIINHYNLDRDPNYNYPVFNRDSLTMICTGVGRENVRRVMFDYYSKILEWRNFQVINVGIAGGKIGKCKIGQCFVVDQVFDDRLDKVYKLNNVFDSQISSNHITTVTNPVIDGGDNHNWLVDMEAHEICSVTDDFYYLKNLFIIKIVSDYMDIGEKKYNYNCVKDLVEDNLLQIDKFLNGLQKY
tara:strand:+ start:84 stop:680 length:597 start_codon:yes stop_codon:yes gene_type:complete